MSAVWYGDRRMCLTTVGNDLVALASGPTNSLPVTNADDCLLMRIRPSGSITVTKLRWMTGGVSIGNYDVGLMDATGTRLWSKGSTAWPAINTVVSETVSSVLLERGYDYWVALAGSNATAQFRSPSVVSASLQFDADDLAVGRRVPTSFPIPASVAAVAATASSRPFFASLHGTAA